MYDNIGNRLFISEVLTIALLTIIGCMYSFLYEIGYFIIFGIPISLLGINIYSIKIPIFILATYSITIFSLVTLYFVFKFFSDKILTLLYYIIIFIIAFDMIMITIYLLYKIWNIFIIIVVFLLGTIYSKYLLTLILMPCRHQYSYKKEVPRDNSVPIYTEYKVKINSDTKLYAVQEEVNIDKHPYMKEQVTEVKASIKSNIIIIALLILFSIISTAIGIVQAVTKEEYNVVNTSPEMVVLRIYGDNIICAPFNRISKKIYKDYVVKNINDFNLVMTLEKIGPLSAID